MPVCDDALKPAVGGAGPVKGGAVFRGGLVSNLKRVLHFLTERFSFEFWFGAGEACARGSTG